MNCEQQALYDRLQAFEFDEPGTELTFARRLARENGWNLLYAERVIEEYKRFLFLACAAGHVVSPSEQVDQAWHLHLTYTRSYWTNLCPNVLRRDLHHGPTKGGAQEQARFIDLYNQTLASYERHFGARPPADIWPPANRRFGEDLRHVSVNLDHNWIIPKPWKRGLGMPVGAGGPTGPAQQINAVLQAARWKSATRLPLCAVALFGLPLAAVNPLDWRGPQFLAFYIGITLLAAVAAVVIRILGNSEPVADFHAKPKLGPYEAACLSAGPNRAVQAAFAALVQDGALAIVETKSTVLGIFTTTKRHIKQASPLPKNAARLEQALYSAAETPASDLAPLAKAGAPIAKEIEEDLQKRGLLASYSPTFASLLAGVVMAAPLALGVPKIVVGLSRGRPVEFLVAACFFTFFAALGFLFLRSRLSAAGKSALESLKQEHASLATPATDSASALAPHDLALALGLFGCGLLAAGPLANVHAMLPKAAGGGGCTTSGGGCGGSGCGGGGCGGGGCGGCGGGD